MQPDTSRLLQQSVDRAHVIPPPSTRSGSLRLHQRYSKGQIQVIYSGASNGIRKETRLRNLSQRKGWYLLMRSRNNSSLEQRGARHTSIGRPSSITSDPLPLMATRVSIQSGPIIASLLGQKFEATVSVLHSRAHRVRCGTLEIPSRSLGSAHACRQRRI
jgi:hypothetical protein